MRASFCKRRLIQIFLLASLTGLLRDTKKAVCAFFIFSVKIEDKGHKKHRTLSIFWLLKYLILKVYSFYPLQKIKIQRVMAASLTGFFHSRVFLRLRREKSWFLYARFFSRDTGCAQVVSLIENKGHTLKKKGKHRIGLISLNFHIL